jgi:hypothetical protein
MSFSLMRIHVLVQLALATPLAAQQPSPRQLTAADYARAERYLGTNTVPLVIGIGVRPTWLENNRFWYRTSVPNGYAFYLVDPARRTRADAFDRARLARGLSAAIDSALDASRPPFSSIEYAKDMRSVTVSARNRRWTCNLQTYVCAAIDTSRASGAAMDAPRNSSVSPDGRRAAFIRDHNLWVKDLVTGRETQLTTDGTREFGYATDNAGWVHSDRPVLTWSPDSRRIATFQHDGRGVRDMVLASTNVGVPNPMIWKYPLPGDSVIFRIHRVIIDVDPVKVTRLQMPPDQHRSTVSDHVSCGGEVCDLQWYPDASHIGFISSSRDHKQAWMRVANATTGAVRTLLHETSKTQVGDASLTENLWRVLPSSNELIWW